MACGEPAKKREFASKVVKTIAVVSLVCITLYYIL